MKVRDPTKTSPQEFLPLKLVHSQHPVIHHNYHYIFLPVSNSSSFCSRQADLGYVSLDDPVLLDFKVPFCPTMSVFRCVQKSLIFSLSSFFLL